MAKPNYGFEKRQRELAKKKKQEEKSARKREARGIPSVVDTANDLPAQPSLAEPAPAAPSAPAPRIHRRTPGGERAGD